MYILKYAVQKISPSVKCLIFPSLCTD